jgi:hypothetical protein
LHLLNRGGCFGRIASGSIDQNINLTQLLVDNGLSCFERLFVQNIGRNTYAFHAGFFLDLSGQFYGSFFVDIYYGGFNTGRGQASCQ